MHPRPSRRRPRALAATTLLASAALLLSACGGGAGGPSAAAADAGPPVPGGTLRFAVGSDQGCVDPQQVASNDSIYSARQVVDSLTDQDPETGEIVPWLAESWQPNVDASAWTFTLRDGVTFSDGTPLDAEAVKANFDRVPALGIRANLPKGYLTGYTGTTVDGPLQLTVSFEGPNVQFLQGTSTHSLGILSPATAALSDDERCAAVVGSGPFVLDTYTPNQSITFTKRAGYAWGSSLWGHDGEAYLDRLEFEIVPESGVRSGSLAAGEVDAIGSIGQQDESPLTGAGAQLLARPNPGQVFGLSFNNARPIVSDPAVRTAVAAAIDRAEVVAAVFTSQTQPATSVLSSTTPDYASQESLLAFDAGRAASLLDGAGWVAGPDGIRAKDGQRLALEVVYFANAGTNKPALELVQQQLRAAGIEVALSERPIADSQAVSQSGEFDALWGNLTRADPDILRSQFSTRLTNFYRLPPSELDDVLAQQAATPDPAARGELVARAQQLISENAYSVPVAELTTVLATGPDVHGVRFDASSRIALFDTWKAS
ncbi:ABC transporter substrate-binding protein [Pseudonocardia broussonetiae]|uniref:ABC transporter substrate-binding protein n=1 Tax=Pseudonocardia broussonetiae TaxID=2736640 RepID=A0A6M6JUV5_9PSEU|nr:ABC transporter substrate-binding protein [Pseudonocardia broussonetiae]QJY49891.1 ABC transporter substrate-binding protein [Pseudonocardia broussonetiae]